MTAPAQLDLGLVNVDLAGRLVRNVRAATDAALANLAVRAIIESGRFGWTVETVRRNPPVWFAFELGMVGAGLAELQDAMRYAERRRLGDFRAVYLVGPDDAVSASNVLVVLGRRHPRRVRHDVRAALKAKLGRDRAAVRYAMRFTQARFVEHVRERRGLSTRIRRATGLTVRAFWRRARGAS